MYCPVCREPGQFPWQHADDCSAKQGHVLRWYEFGVPVLLLLLLSETALLIVAFFLVGRCP
jgi:hypothetical protein